MAARKRSGKKATNSEPVADVDEVIADADEVIADDTTDTVKLVRGKVAMVKDPRIWARSLPNMMPPYKRILGLDLSGSCGASFCDILPGQPITAAPIIGGQWNLSIGPHDTNSIRYVRLKQFLELTAPSLICYEEVKFTGAPIGGMSLAAIVSRAITGAQVVHSLSAVLTMWAEERGVPCQSVPIGSLKKFATQRGNANKLEMIAACNEQFGTEFIAEDYANTGVDNIADSMFLCYMGVTLYAEGLR